MEESAELSITTHLGSRSMQTARRSRKTREMGRTGPPIREEQVGWNDDNSSELSSRQLLVGTTSYHEPCTTDHVRAGRFEAKSKPTWMYMDARRSQFAFRTVASEITSSLHLLKHNETCWRVAPRQHVNEGCRRERQ